MTKAVIFELSLVIIWNVKSFQDLVIFEFETCFHSTILHKTENLNIEHRVLDDTAISADLLILNISFANIAAILNFNEVNVHNEAAYFDHVPNNLIKRYLLKQHNAVICFEVIYFFGYSADQFQISFAQM